MKPGEDVIFSAEIPGRGNRTEKRMGEFIGTRVTKILGVETLLFVVRDWNGSVHETHCPPKKC